MRGVQSKRQAGHSCIGSVGFVDKGKGMRSSGQAESVRGVDSARGGPDFGQADRANWDMFRP